MKKHWSLRYAFFIFSVISLSWFFAGWRGIHEHGGVADWALLIGASLLTVALLGVQGYWIYTEELTKGSLKRRIGLFDRIHAKMSAGTADGALQGAVANKKGEL